jgi:hypothetical protein
MEPKAKTLQERFGFADPDLKTPKHDAIMFWLDTEIPTVLTQLFGAPRWEYRDSFDSSYYPSGMPEGGMLAAKPGLKEEINAELGITSLPPKRSIVKVWERPILDRARSSTYTIGFADMYVSWGDQWIDCLWKPWSPFEFIKSRVITARDRGVYFEVKPNISSLGELIRQLRMYRTYTEPEEKWVVVSPDTRFADKLREQGFGFIAVPQAVPA